MHTYYKIFKNIIYLNKSNVHVIIVIKIQIHFPTQFIILQTYPLHHLTSKGTASEIKKSTGVGKYSTARPC